MTLEKKKQIIQEKRIVWRFITKDPSLYSALKTFSVIKRQIVIKNLSFGKTKIGFLTLPNMFAILYLAD